MQVDVPTDCARRGGEALSVDTVLLDTSLAGLTIPFGGLLARLERIRLSHSRMDLLTTIVAFGGGLVIAAATLILMPHGVEVEQITPAAVGLLVGGGAILFLLIDRAIEMRGARWTTSSRRRWTSSRSRSPSAPRSRWAGRR